MAFPTEISSDENGGTVRLPLAAPLPPPPAGQAWADVSTVEDHKNGERVIVATTDAPFRPRGRTGFEYLPAGFRADPSAPLGNGAEDAAAMLIPYTQPASPSWVTLTAWFGDQHGKPREEPVDVAVAHVVTVSAAEGPPRKPPGASVCLADGRRLSVVEDRETVLRRLTGVDVPVIIPREPVKYDLGDGE